jgi:hypothetical protein
MQELIKLCELLLQAVVFKILQKAAAFVLKTGIQTEACLAVSILVLLVKVQSSQDLLHKSYEKCWKKIIFIRISSTFEAGMTYLKYEPCQLVIHNKVTHQRAS